MLANEGSNEPRQHIGATTRASRDDQFHRFLGFPGRDVAEPYEQYRQYTYYRCRPDPLLHVVLLWRQLFWILTPRYVRSVDSAVRYAKNVRWMRSLQPDPAAVIAALHPWKNSPCLYAQSRSHTSQGLQNFSRRATRRVSPSYWGLLGGAGSRTMTGTAWSTRVAERTVASTGVHRVGYCCSRAREAHSAVQGLTRGRLLPPACRYHCEETDDGHHTSEGCVSQYACHLSSRGWEDGQDYSWEFLPQMPGDALSYY